VRSLPASGVSTSLLPTCGTARLARTRAADFEDPDVRYTPEELGIDAKNAAAIETIRPTSSCSSQPTLGHLFVKFEPRGASLWHCAAF